MNESEQADGAWQESYAGNTCGIDPSTTTTTATAGATSTTVSSNTNTNTAITSTSSTITDKTNVEILDNNKSSEEYTKNTKNNIIINNTKVEKDKNEKKRSQNFIIPMFNIKSHDESYLEKRGIEQEREMEMEREREREKEEEEKKRLSLPARDENGSLQTVKQLFRIIGKGGRVKYVVIYVDGEVREANSSNIYDFAPPPVVHKYEHMCFLKNYNMETVYVKDSDMGAWAKGTSIVIIKEMERAVRQAHKLAQRLSASKDPKEGSTSATDSEVPRLLHPARQSGRVSRKRVSSKVPAFGTSEADGDRARHEEHSDSSSDFPPFKKAKQIVMVSAPIGNRMTIVATPPMKQAPITRFFGKSSIPLGSPLNGTAQLKQGSIVTSHPDIQPHYNVEQKHNSSSPFIISETGPENHRDELSEYEVEAIVKHRVQDGVTHYLVKWVGFPSEENTWEPAENLAGSSDLVQIYLEDIQSPG